MTQAGVLLSNGCRFTHGTGASIMTPFHEIPLVMHELYPGGGDATSFRGQFGFIPFTDAFRLPRHVHIAEADHGRLLAERILVLNGVALTELNGHVFVVAPGTLVDIAPGVPHTWTACPPGVRLPDGSRSAGQFMMIYEYAERTGFFPTASTAPITGVADYKAHRGDLEEIRFPRLTPRDVAGRASLVWNTDPHAGLDIEA